jgi:hypothetical protein
MTNILNTIKPSCRRVADILVTTIRRWTRVVGIEYVIYRRRNRRRRYIASQCTSFCVKNFSLEMIREKKLIFTVTAGRSGTMFLQQLLELAPNITSLHEPDPAFHSCLRRIQREPEYARDFLLNLKLPAIANYPTPYYAEVSHVFCKGFLSPLLDMGIIPNLIVLRRSPRLIALSYLSSNTVPERTALGKEYLLSPDDPGVVPLRNWRRMSDYQLLFWYAIEIERRQAAYARLVTGLGGIVHDTTAEELHDADCYFRLCERLGVLDQQCDRAMLGERHAVVKGYRYNQNRSSIRYVGDLDSQEQQVWDALLGCDEELQSTIEARYQI